MYHRIYHLLAGLLIFCAACRREPQNDCVHQLLDAGPPAKAMLTRDPVEGYFEIVTSHDIQLQMGVVFDTLVNLEMYRDWLSGLVLDWSAADRKRGDRLLGSAVADVEKMFPRLLPDTIYLVLLDNEPYGPNIYFTRNNAIFVPRQEIENATDEVLKNVLVHELFHLISRKHNQWRETLYAVAGFVPATAAVSLDSLNVDPLTNPDAPNSDYWLPYNDGNFYVPLLYATGTSNDFESAMNFGVHKVAMPKKKKSTMLSQDSMVTAYAAERALWMHQIVQATRANTNYLIHPEEILADHFSLLVAGERQGLLFPEELEELRGILEAIGR